MYFLIFSVNLFFRILKLYKFYSQNIYVFDLETTFNKLPSTHFNATGLFLYPGKDEIVSGFLMFSGGVERDQCYEMGQ